MSYAIRVRIGELAFEGELNETATAGEVRDALPLEGRANRWGDEIYFAIPATGDDADPVRTEMSPGELAFWPPGRAFCIFWGRTPASIADEPRAASDVVPIGRLTGDLDRLARTQDGQTVRVETR